MASRNSKGSPYGQRDGSGSSYGQDDGRKPQGPQYSWRDSRSGGQGQNTNEDTTGTGGRRDDKSQDRGNK